MTPYSAETGEGKDLSGMCGSYTSDGLTEHRLFIRLDVQIARKIPPIVKITYLLGFFSPLVSFKTLGMCGHHKMITSSDPLTAVILININYVPGQLNQDDRTCITRWLQGEKRYRPNRQRTRQVLGGNQEECRGKILLLSGCTEHQVQVLHPRFDVDNAE
ncbi:hypothetical protein KQX54_015296 [Cotesia glomerata]|uniref:Uncharacterized protein n=1 Tax=Cotesia glomerata TaxID=32391 RepID=A0AAV7IV84_COTGL|nr:hypothetical protein KQX54_015296 [Cotesia glomerata]